MSRPTLPVGDGNVPDKVLEELLAAFAADDAPIISPAAEPPPAEPPPAEPPPAEPARRPIQIGTGEDFVDAVYLDEEGAERLRNEGTRATEASIERTTIRIGDDEVEGSSGGIPVATGSAMDPRLRARRIAVKRAVGRRRLTWFVVAGAVVVVIAGALALLGSSLFAVEHVAASGVTGNTRTAYEAAEADLVGTPVLLVDTHAIESRLEKDPWIRQARVTTDFPSGASIEIVERVPVATYLGTDGRYRVIDVDGAVLTVLPGRPLALMLLTGPGPDAEAGGTAGEGLRHGAELAQALSPAARSRTDEVVVGETGELSLRFADTTVILGAPVDLLDKLTRLEATLSREDVDTYTLIDVSTAEIGLR